MNVDVQDGLPCGDADICAYVEAIETGGCP